MRWWVHGLVQAGYAPVWALAGLGLERLHDLLDPEPGRDGKPEPASAPKP